MIYHSAWKQSQLAGTKLLAVASAFIASYKSEAMEMEKSHAEVSGWYGWSNSNRRGRSRVSR
jgi:hypothetical protein